MTSLLLCKNLGMISVFNGITLKKFHCTYIVRFCGLNILKLIMAQTEVPRLEVFKNSLKFLETQDRMSSFSENLLHYNQHLNKILGQLVKQASSSFTSFCSAGNGDGKGNANQSDDWTSNVYS